MEIKIPKEVREYHETIFFGLNTRQFVCSLLAVGVAVAVYFLLQPMLDTEEIGWVCILAAAPFAVCGFFTYHGMTPEQLLWAWCKSELLCPKRLVFRSDSYYYAAMQPAIQAGLHQKRKRGKRMLIKNIMSIASLVLLLPLGALIVGWGGTLFYTFVFRFLRARTGGYHAKTPHGCLLGSVCCQSVMLFLSAHMPDPVVSAFIAGFSCLSIALFGPANHPELHLSEKELKALQPRIYIRLLIVVALTAVLLFFRPDWGACTAFGVFAAALLLVISLQGYGAQ